MRLLMTTDTVGGVWTYTRELVSGLLAGTDVEIALVALGGPLSFDQERWLDRTKRAHRHRFRCASKDVPLEWQQNNAAAYSAAAPLLMKQIESFQPDLIHTNQFCFGALPVSVPKLVFAHSDVLSWHRATRGTAPEESPWLRQYCDLVRAGLDGAAVVAAPTQAAIDDLCHGFPLTQETRVIPNGIDVAPPSRLTRKLQAITAGRLWDEAKNVALLEQVHSPMPLLVAGHAHHDGVRYTPREGSSLHLLGPLPSCALLRAFAESSVYIITSLYEPFGLAPVEAARCGCAVLSFDIPSLREVWGDAALYFRTAGELSALLQNIAADPALLARAQQRAGDRSALYTADRMVHAHRELYCELLPAACETERLYA